MGIIIGAGVSRPIHPNHLLSLGEFSETKVYNAGDFVIYQNKIYRFTTSHASGPWDSSEVKQSSSLDIIVSAVGDPRIKPISANNVSEGDMLFYDRLLSCYCIVKKAAIAAVLTDFNRTRYETNYDTYVGTFNEVAHFVGMKDAMASNPLYGDTIAATSCFYRIEIDNTQAGSITFSAANGNATIAETTIPWSAGDSMDSIVALFVEKNTTYITFGALADGSGVGLEIGGYGANTMTVTDSTACEVIDCSRFAFYFSQNPSMKVAMISIRQAPILTLVLVLITIGEVQLHLQSLLAKGLLDQAPLALAIPTRIIHIALVSTSPGSNRGQAQTAMPHSVLMVLMAPPTHPVAK